MADLLQTPDDNDYLRKAVDIAIRLALIALFVIVGAIQEVGLISVIAEAIGDLVGEGEVLGQVAGNLALTLGAWDGIYIGGGIAPKILPRLQGSGFMQGFTAKGRMRELLESMPVRVILNDRTALFGPALYASQRAK